MCRETYKKILIKYIPENSIEQIIDLIIKHNIHLKITKNRFTKLGDFKPSLKTKINKITINHNLNKYHFLIILLHEIAHAVTWEQLSTKRINPHGKEWQNSFKILMSQFVNDNTFPIEIINILKKHMINPKASSLSDLELARILKNYDNNNLIYLEDIPENAKFSLNNGHIFVKGEKIRKRYRCKNIINNRMYLVSPLANVEIVSDSNN